MNIDGKIIKLISLEGKTAVITGAAAGIGLGTAKRLAEAGAGVALLDTDSEKGVTAEKEILDQGGRATFYLCDVTSGADCKKVTASVYEDFGGIDILFNNAGVIRRKNVVDLKEAEWDLVVNVNLKGVYLMSRHVIPYMIKGHGGSIINTGSGWGIKGGADAVAYCAAKGGVVNMTRAMAIDHGRQNIRVNCVCPGDTDTEMLRREAAELGEDERAYIKQAADRPINRVGLPEDIANAVLYLASDLAGWVTGSILVIDGGGLA